MIAPRSRDSRSPTDRDSQVPIACPLVPYRSILFNALFYANLTVHMVVALPTLLLPHRAHARLHPRLARTSLWLLRVVCGIKVEWRGTEKIAARRLHRRLQASVGVGDLRAVRRARRSDLRPQARTDVDSVLRLVHLEGRPHSGRSQRRHGGAVADDGARRKAARRGRQIVIFPEGTRRPPGAEPDYKPGIAHLYSKAGVPCVPMALNSGLFWPRRSLLRPPGTIVVEMLDPIAPGLDREPS